MTGLERSLGGDECEEEDEKEGLCIKVDDCNGHGVGEGGLLMKLEIVCMLLSEWQDLCHFLSMFKPFSPSHNAIKQFHTYLYGTIVIQSILFRNGGFKILQTTLTNW